MFWTNRCPKISIGQFWTNGCLKIGFQQIYAKKEVWGSFGKKVPKTGAQNLFWAGQFKLAQNYGLNHPCPKLANPVSNYLYCSHTARAPHHTTLKSSAIFNPNSALSAHQSHSIDSTSYPRLTCTDEANGNVP